MGDARVLLATGGFTGNAMDVGAVDAEVVQFAGGHAAEFVDGLTILAPVVVRASDVHRNPLSEGCLPAALCCAGFRLMSWNIID